MPQSESLDSELLLIPQAPVLHEMISLTQSFEVGGYLCIQSLRQ